MDNDSIVRARERVLNSMALSLPSRDPRTQEAIDLLAKVAPGLQDLFWDSDNELISMIAASSSGEEANESLAENARTFTDEERSRFEREIFAEEIFGDDIFKVIADQKGFAEPVRDNLHKLLDKEVNEAAAAVNRSAARLPDVPGQPEIRRSENLHPTGPRIKSELIRRLNAIAKESEASSPFTMPIASTRRLPRSWEVADPHNFGPWVA